MNEYSVLADIAAQLGAGAALLLLIAIVALAREWVVPGAAYRRHVKECSERIAKQDERIGELEQRWDDSLSLGEEAAALLPRARRQQ